MDDNDEFRLGDEERHEELEARIEQLVQDLARDFADLGDGLRWSIVQALIHRAVHFAVERDDIEFCTLSTYLAEMIGHAHDLSHGHEPSAPPRREFVH